MYRKLDKNNTKNDRTLTLLIYYKIVHHFTLLVGNFCLQPGTKMLRHSTGKPDFFLLNITPTHISVRPNRPPSLLPNLKHGLANLRSGGGGGVTSTTRT